MPPKTDREIYLEYGRIIIQHYNANIAVIGAFGADYIAAVAHRAAALAELTKYTTIHRTTINKLHKP